jgi:hypothetical protein
MKISFEKYFLFYILILLYFITGMCALQPSRKNWETFIQFLRISKALLLGCYIDQQIGAAIIASSEKETNISCKTIFLA